MFFLKRKIYYIIIILIISLIFYRTFIKTGYGQAIVIEDTFWGVDKKVIPPESFSFIIRRIIPNRIHLHPIYIKSRFLDYIYSFSLPPNEILGLDDSFSIKVHLVYMYDLDVNKLSDIFIRLDQNWKNLDSFIKIKLKDILFETLKEELKIENNLNRGEEVLKAYIHNGFLRKINQNFEQDGIYFKKIYIQDIYVPDPQQYNLLLQQSAKYLEKKLEKSILIDEAKAKKESNSILFEFEKEKLETIAKLIRNYPEIKDYLKIEKLSSQAKFIYIPNDNFWNTTMENSSSSIKEKENDPLYKQKNKNINIEDNANSSLKNQNANRFIDKTPP